MKRHFAAGRPRFKPSPQAHRQIFTQFLRAVEQGELDGLMQLLSDDVELWVDGGGKARGAATRPLHGRTAVAQLRRAGSDPGPPVLERRCLLSLRKEEL